MHPAFLEN